MAGVTQEGVLPIGIVVDGERHTVFELRSVTVGDNVDVIEELGDVSALRLSAALYARQLMRLGSMPKERITAVLVLALHPEDFNALEEAHAQLKKKLHEHGQPWLGGTPSAPFASNAA